MEHLIEMLRREKLRTQTSQLSIITWEATVKMIAKRFAESNSCFSTGWFTRECNKEWHTCSECGHVELRDDPQFIDTDDEF